MQIQNRFEVPMRPVDAWALLMNISETVPCFPGAELTEAIDQDHYTGRVTVKLGPLTMVFNGKLRIEDRNDAGRSATVKANWTETRGRGNAVTVTRFAMREQGAGTLVELETDVQLAGQVAQYGRGAGMISAISAELIATFAENIRTRINEISSTQAGAPPEERATAPSADPRARAQRGELSVPGLLWKALLARLARFFRTTARKQHGDSKHAR